MALSDAEIKRFAQQAESLEESGGIVQLKQAIRCYDQIINYCLHVTNYHNKRGDVKYRSTGLGA
jgi:hypothetical protein